MLNDRYTVSEVIGKGGWGEVSLGQDSRTGQSVAIKKIPLDMGLPADTIRTEIDTLARLDHPGVVHYVDSFSDEEAVYAVNEYIKGETLEQILAKGPLPPQRVERYTQQVLDALGYVHSQGIIHSDLKPGNLMIDESDNVRLIDFGLVRTASAEIAADIKEIRGTLEYMSPEQADGNPYDIRSDIFSLGVVLYELCTGRKPFTGEYDMAIIYSILYEDPVPPDKINPEVSPALSDAILKLLTKSPAERPASAAHVAEMLRGAFTPAKTEETADGNRLAVLPFEFPADDADSGRIAVGLLDEFHVRLKQLQGLDVISPIKVAQRAGKLTDGQAVRTLLGGDYYLTGSVRRMADWVRIYVMLNRAADDGVIWSDKFDSSMSNLFDVIDTITEKVTDCCRSHLIPDKMQKRPGATTTKPEAYELYLLARGYYVKYSRQDFELARNMYLEALKIDPDYALAHVGVADCYCAEFMNYFDRSDEAVAKATRWAEKALEIVPDLPEAYRALGRIMQTTGRAKEAEAYYLKAVTYKEDYYQAYRSLGWLAKDALKYGEALRWIRKSLSINSTDLETIFLKGVLHFERRESKHAVNDFTRCLELRPDYGRAYFALGLVYSQLGRISDAVEAMTKAVNFGGDINAPYMLGYLYMCSGDYIKSINYLQQAVQYKEIAFAARYFLGIVCTLTDQPDIARTCFDAVVSECRDLLEGQGDFVMARAVLIQALAMTGEQDMCRAEIERLLPHVDEDGSIAYEVARAYAIMGDAEMARRYIGIAIDTHQGPTQAEIDQDPILKRFMPADES